MKKSKYKAEEAGHYGGARLTVMQPTVVNENNVPREVPSVNVSSEGLVWCVVMVIRLSTGTVTSMGTVFCHNECEFGAKEELPLPEITNLNEEIPDFAKEHVDDYPGETKIDDVNMDYQREDGK